MITRLILAFILLVNLLRSQTTFDFTPYEYGRFKVSGNAYCGVGNAYCCVTRSQSPNQFGNFVYQFYFSSNSYLGNCQASKTYIPDIEIIYCDNQNGIYYYPNNFYRFWISVYQTSLVYTLYHPSPNLLIRVRTGYMQPTNY